MRNSYQRSRSHLFVLATVLLLLSGIGAHAEVRGLWVVRDAIRTPDGVKRLVEFADAHHFNVLFIQVRGRGDAYYKSYFVPGPEDYPTIPSKFDPLEEVIRLAHAKNIEVHAWLNMYLTWSDDDSPKDQRHPFNAHPDWFMVSVDGVSMAKCPITDVRNTLCEGRYLSPTLEAVRSYMSRVVTEIVVTYNVDGIQMDYIRFPGRGYDFHPYARWEFNGKNGVDPVDVVKGNGSADPALMYLGKWVEYRADLIDRQVRSIRKRIDLVDPKIRLSAAVKPHADEALYQFGQNWAGWLNEGIVDFVVTMSYYSGTDDLVRAMNVNIEKADRNKIIGGVGVYRLQAEQAASQINALRKLGLPGYCCFSYTTFIENPGLIDKIDTLAGSSDTKLPVSFKPYVRKLYD